jgi:uncharacterized repeat protein (TIGR02543 family)
LNKQNNDKKIRWLKKKPAKQTMHRLKMVVASTVVFVTAYALSMPAITLSSKTFCGLQEHTHTSECYISSTPLCQKEESEDSGHSHDESCYRSETALCNKEEHVHTRQCESNPEAAETKDDWQKSIPETLDEDLNSAIVQVADSQLDYKESTENFLVQEDGSEKGFSRYGAWEDDPYEDWNVAFVGFVLNYANASLDAMHYDKDLGTWYQEADALLESDLDKIEPGNVVFFQDAKSKEENVGIVKVYDDTKNSLQVYAGDEDDGVALIDLDSKHVLAYMQAISNISQSKVQSQKNETTKNTVYKASLHTENLAENTSQTFSLTDELPVTVKNEEDKSLEIDAIPADALWSTSDEAVAKALINQDAGTISIQTAKAGKAVLQASWQNEAGEQILLEKEIQVSKGYTVRFYYNAPDGSKEQVASLCLVAKEGKLTIPFEQVSLLDPNNTDASYMVEKDGLLYTLYGWSFDSIANTSTKSDIYTVSETFDLDALSMENNTIDVYGIWSIQESGTSSTLKTSFYLSYNEQTTQAIENADDQSEIAHALSIYKPMYDSAQINANIREEAGINAMQMLKAINASEMKDENGKVLNVVAVNDRLYRADTSKKEGYNPNKEVQIVWTSQNYDETKHVWSVTGTIITADKWSLSYDANCSLQTSLPDAKYDLNESASIADLDVSRDGYTFLGWSTSPIWESEEKDGQLYKAKDTITSDTSQNIVLYAIWQTDTSKLIITSLDEQNNPVANLGYVLYAYDGEKQEYIFAGQGTSDAQGKVLIENLQSDTNYKLSQIQTPDTLQKSEDVLFALEEETDGSLAFCLLEENEQVLDAGYDEDTQILSLSMLEKSSDAIQIQTISSTYRNVNLPGAEYSLYKAKEENGEYVKDTSYEAIEAISNSDGLATLGNLAEGKYLLYETKAPSGYVLNSNPVLLSIELENGQEQVYIDRTNILAGQDPVYDETNGVWTIYISNTTGTQLPQAGGAGVKLYAYSGALLMAAALGMYELKKAKR